MKKAAFRKIVWVGTLSCALAAVAPAQDNSSANNTTANAGGWRKVGESSSPSPSVTSAQNDPPPPADPSAASTPDQQPPYSSSAPTVQQPAPVPQPQPMQSAPPSGAYSQQQPNSGYGPSGNGYSQQQPVPAQVTVPAGTYLTVRINQTLSSDHNQMGDPFTATLVNPLIANGVVVANPGQTIGGRVSQSQKAGRVEGLAKLGVELTNITVADGQQLPVQTAFISRTANSSVGRDAGAIAGTTGLGAVIGAAAGWGRGAAIGAGAGAAAGIIGVLVTRGRPSVIYPEQVLTFRLQQPLIVDTQQATQAFHYVQPGEYDQAGYSQNPNYRMPAPPPVAYGPAPAPYPYYGYGYPYAYGYPYGGFSFFVGGGPGYWGRGYWGRGGWGGYGYRGWRR